MSAQKGPCTDTDQLNVKPDSYIHFVIDSVFAIAHAIEAIIKKSCSHLSEDKLFECRDLVPIKGARLLKEILNIEFTSVTNRKVRFSQLGDGLVPYEIFQYQKKSDGEYVYEKIAKWDGEEDN